MSREVSHWLYIVFVSSFIRWFVYLFSRLFTNISFLFRDDFVCVCVCSFFLHLCLTSGGFEAIGKRVTGFEQFVLQSWFLLSSLIVDLLIYSFLRISIDFRTVLTCVCLSSTSLFMHPSSIPSSFISCRLGGFESGFEQSSFSIHGSLVSIHWLVYSFIIYFQAVLPCM